MQTQARGLATHRSVPILIVAVATLAIACGASAGASPAPVGQPVGAGSGNSGAQAPAASAAPGAPAEGTDGLVGQGGNAAFQDGAKIIRTGSLQLEVGDVPAALTSARKAIAGLGGYIGASQQYQDGDNVVATITYRIPADRWEDALDSLRKLGKEVGEQTNSADVTGQIVDLDARIRNLKASETALVGYIARATKVADVLEIESRLSDVRGQIEQLSAQKASLDDQVAYATLAVTFGVEVQAVKAAAAQWDPSGEVDRAGASLVGFLQALATAGIWFAIVWLPILAVLAIVVGLVVFVGRRFGLFRRSPGPPPVPPMPPTPPAVAEG
jgi:Domain of unknown function (DUF4349)